MAVYKVIQDIEAEDKLLGPLTLKGLIYVGIAALLGFINFKLITSGIPIFVKLPIVIVFSMPMALFGILASPLGRDQPTEVWLLAHLKFFLKPRQRLWNQSGISQLVTITVPKRLERHLTKGYSQLEVQSRLKALATTLDSRGWVVKNVNVNLNSQPDYITSTEQSSDRLIAASVMTREVPEIDVQANDDIMDEKNNATAQKFQAMMLEAEAKRKQELARKLEESKAQAQAEQARSQEAALKTPAQNQTQPSKPTHTTNTETEPPVWVEPMAVMGTTVVTPKKVEPLAETEHSKTQEALGKEEKQLLERIHREKATMKTAAVKPPPIVQIHGGKVIQPANTMTPASQTDKLELAQSGNDFSVATIAQLANRPAQS